ncbi:MAG TPA: ABC transporter ATP-binding protein, partial [Longimicrobiales bacterium]|nr:ABC transporter ATP-binding protein [Longimicrobiales bacterium]
MNPLLDVRALTVVFPGSHGGAPVVRDLSLEVAAGETVALVGESGSGKTVTALSVMGLLPHSGAQVMAGSSIRVDGVEVVGASPAVMGTIRGRIAGMIFQDTGAALNPVRRVGSQLREVLRRHRALSGVDAVRASQALLGEVGLPDPAGVAGSFPHQLSGGMRQRALIALALAGDPRLLLADEPTSALDAPLRLQILELLRSLNRSRGLGTLLITHDFGVVAHAADRVVVMYAGEVVETGTVAEILARPV